MRSLKLACLSLFVALALLIGVPLSAINEGRVDAAHVASSLPRTFLIQEPEDDEGDDGLDTPTPTDNDGTDSDGIDTTGLLATDNDGIDTPTPTDNDGTDSRRYRHHRVAGDGQRRD